MAEDKKEGKRNAMSAPRKKWRMIDLIWQLTVVIIGVLITFQGSAWVERSSQRGQMRKILGNVADEMESNLQIIENAREMAGMELAAAGFFSRHIDGLHDAPADSVDMYIAVLEYNLRYFAISDALEVLKTSVSSINVVDKELLQRIFSCYNTVDMLYYNINHYYGEKDALLKAFRASADIDITRDPHKNPYPYLDKYFGTPAARNFLLMTTSHLTPNMPFLEMMSERYGETIENINDYIGGNSKSRTK